MHVFSALGCILKEFMLVDQPLKMQRREKNALKNRKCKRAFQYIEKADQIQKSIHLTEQQGLKKITLFPQFCI